MTGCVVADCNYSHKNPAPKEALNHVPEEVGFRMLRFPERNNPLWKIWLLKSGRPLENFLSLENLRICSVHFEPDMFKADLIERLKRQGRKVALNVRALLTTAIPTLYLPISGSTKQLSGSSKRKAARKEKEMKKKREEASLETEATLMEKLSAISYQIQPAVGTEHDMDYSRDGARDEAENMISVEMSQIVEHFLPIEEQTVHQSPTDEHCYANFANFNNNRCAVDKVTPLKEPSKNMLKLQSIIFKNANKNQKSATNEQAAAPNDSCSTLGYPKKWELIDSETLQAVVALLEEYDTREKKLIKTAAEMNEDAKMQNLMKNDLLLKLQKAQGEICKIKEALSSHFTKSQVDRITSQCKTRWNDDDYANAIVLLGLSPKGYRYLRSQMKFPMPSVRSVKRVTSGFKEQPGLMRNVIRVMSMLGKSMSEKDRLCVITFDEMKISSRRFYNQKMDMITGPCQYVQVIYVRSLFSTWRNPIYYGFDTPVTKDLMKMVLIELKEAGFEVCALNSDLGSSNRTFFDSMGVTIEKPFFPHPTTKKNIYCFADIPHCMKLARNHALDHDICLNPDDRVEDHKIVNKAPYEELAKLTTQDVGQYTLNLTHVQCQGHERQNVRVAAQLLSNSVAKSLLTAGENKLITSDNYEHASTYSKTFNDLFDLMNIMRDPREECPGEESQHLPHKLPYGANVIEQDQILDKAIEMISKMRKKLKNGFGKMLPFQVGFLMSCNSLKLMHRDLLSRFPDQPIEILTYRINQDPVENLFSLMRSAGGANTNPGPVEFTNRINNYILGNNSESIMKDTVPNVLFEFDSRPVLSAQVARNIQHIEDEDDEEAPNTTRTLLITEKEMIEDDDSSDEEDEPHLSTKTVSQSSLPQDAIINSFYEEGLETIASSVCYKVMKNFPEYLSSDTPVGMRGPNWARYLSKKGQAPATATLKEYVIKMDKTFQNMHGTDLDKDPKVIKRFREKVLERLPYIEPEVANAFGQIRLQVRIRGLNRRDKYVQAQKKEEKRIKKEAAAQKRKEREERSRQKGTRAAVKRKASSQSQPRKETKRRKILPKQSREYQKNKNYVS